jgi:glycosyltransferase involved in cell wall biosynthesis
VRLVDITSFFPTSCGGIKRYYCEKARVLPRRGIDCHFVAPGPALGEEAFGDGTLHLLPGPRVPFSPEYRLFLPDGNLGRLLRRLQPDVIEIGSHYFLPDMVLRALAPLGARRPALAGFFHTDFPRQLVEPFARRLLPAGIDRAAVTMAWWFARHQFSRYDATLVASREIAEWLRGLGISGVRWVGLGVDVDVFHPAQKPSPSPSLPGPPTVSYVGRLSPEKELDLLLASWDEVHAHTGARLRLVGAGPSRASFERFAASRPSVSVEPYLDQPRDVAAVLAASDVVVLTSGTETFSLATAEALACGTPVVGPARGAVGEMVVASGGGLAFTAGSAPALGHALRTLLSLSPEARRAVGQSGREHVLRDFTWERVGDRLAEAYAAVLEARGSRLGKPLRPRHDACGVGVRAGAVVDAGVVVAPDEPVPQRRAS